MTAAPVANPLSSTDIDCTGAGVPPLSATAKACPKPAEAGEGMAVPRQRAKILLLLFLLTVPLVNPWVRGDGVGYYAYIRSLLVEHKLDFANDWRAANLSFTMGRVHADGTIDPRQYTRTGRLDNHFSVGPSILWAPFVVPVHLAMLTLKSLGANVRPNGFSRPYVVAMALGTALYGFLGLYLSFRFARLYTEERWALLATLGIWFASSLPVYMYFNPSWSHAHSVFIVAAFLWYWHQTRQRRTLRQWVVLGLISGLMLDVYYVNIALLLVPLLESLEGYWRGWASGTRYQVSGVRGQAAQDREQVSGAGCQVPEEREQVTGRREEESLRHSQMANRKSQIANVQSPIADRKSKIANFRSSIENRKSKIENARSLLIANLLYCVAALVAFLPTLITRQIIYGNPLDFGYGELGGFRWGSPYLGSALFSAEHGLLTWTPILILAVAGLFLFLRHNRTVAAYLIMALVAFCYLIGGDPNWAGISSFGNRFFISLTPIFVLGLAVLFSELASLLKSNRGALALAGSLTGLLILWNFAFIFQWGMHLIPVRGAISWKQMARNQVAVVPAKVLTEVKAYFRNRDVLMQQIEHEDLRQLKEAISRQPAAVSSENSVEQ